MALFSGEVFLTGTTAATNFDDGDDDGVTMDWSGWKKYILFFSRFFLFLFFFFLFFLFFSFFLTFFFFDTQYVGLFPMNR